MKKKISIYVRNEHLGPSCYYRIIQYLDQLDADFIIHNMSTEAEFQKNMRLKNILVKKIYQFLLLIKMYFRANRYLREDISKNVDYVIVQRVILPRFSFKKTRRLMKSLFSSSHLIWDFDDNILNSGEIYKKDIDILGKFSKYIIVTHSFLKETLPYSYQSKVYILPTTDYYLNQVYESKNWKEIERIYNKEIRIIWIGTGGNLKEVVKITPILEEAAKILYNTYNKQLWLYIICNDKIDIDYEFLKVKNFQWSRNEVKSRLPECHIGIMPLTNSEYAKGKGGFKLVQYMALGTPVIGSNIGYNSEVIKEGTGILIGDNEREWIDAIIELSTNYDKWKENAYNSKRHFDEVFNPINNINLLREMINQQ